MKASPGDVLEGRYQVVRPLKEGAMGGVLEARDLRTGEAVALKELLPGKQDDDYARRRFTEEARVLARLDRPGIPRVRDSFVQGDHRYLVMDLVQGQTLLEVLQERGGPLEAEEVTRAALEVLDLLEYLHGQDPPLLHRDVKPANLVREASSGRTWLVDFGLACEAGGRKMTRIGTAGYCAVEQVEGRAEPRSDLYSLGATMHHLLAGQAPPPFRYVPLVRFRQDLPARLMDAVATAMAPRAAERFPDAAAFRQALLESRADPARARLERPEAATGVIENAEELVQRARAEWESRRDRR